MSENYIEIKYKQEASDKKNQLEQAIKDAHSEI